MNTPAMIIEFLPSVFDIADSLLSTQQQPYDPYWDDHAVDPHAGGGGIGIGGLIGLMLLVVALNFLMGWWGKSRAEEHGVNQWVGFAMGFFMGFIGVMLVPVLRTDRIVNTRAPRPLPQLPTPTNPMYGPDTQAYPQQGYIPQQQEFPPLQQDPVQPTQQPHATPYQPQSHAHSIQPDFTPTPPAEPSEMLVADDFGYVECPHCQSRTKSGRKACMTCGNFLPPVYDPNIK